MKRAIYAGAVAFLLSGTLASVARDLSPLQGQEELAARRANQVRAAFDALSSSEQVRYHATVTIVVLGVPKAATSDHRVAVEASPPPLCGWEEFLQADANVVEGFSVVKTYQYKVDVAHAKSGGVAVRVSDAAGRPAWTWLTDLRARYAIESAGPDDPPVTHDELAPWDPADPGYRWPCAYCDQIAHCPLRTFAVNSLQAHDRPIPSFYWKHFLKDGVRRVGNVSTDAGNREEDWVANRESPGEQPGSKWMRTDLIRIGGDYLPRIWASREIDLDAAGKVEAVVCTIRAYSPIKGSNLDSSLFLSADPQGTGRPATDASE